MGLRAVPVDRQHPDRAAIMYGPVALAQDEACCRRPFAIAPATELTTRLIKEGESLRFRITKKKGPLGIQPGGPCHISSAGKAGLACQARAERSLRAKSCRAAMPLSSAFLHQA